MIYASMQGPQWQNVLVCDGDNLFEQVVEGGDATWDVHDVNFMLHDDNFEHNVGLELCSGVFVLPAVPSDFEVNEKADKKAEKNKVKKEKKDMKAKKKMKKKKKKKKKMKEGVVEDEEDEEDEEEDEWDELEEKPVIDGYRFRIYMEFGVKEADEDDVEDMAGAMDGIKETSQRTSLAHLYKENLIITMCMCDGPSDAKLKWPFTKKFWITIANKADKDGQPAACRFRVDAPDLYPPNIAQTDESLEYRKSVPLLPLEWLRGKAVDPIAKDLFKSLDPNDEGSLKPEQVKRLAKRLSHNDYEVDALIHNLDANHDGNVDFAEFCQFWQNEYGFGSSFIFADDTIRVNVGFKDNANLAAMGVMLQVRAHRVAEKARANLAAKMLRRKLSKGNENEDSAEDDPEAPSDSVVSGILTTLGSVTTQILEEV